MIFGKIRSRLRKRKEERQEMRSLVADLRGMVAALGALLEQQRAASVTTDEAPVSEAQQKREWFGEDV
ncbi:MAG: hypothetical protein IJC99_04185 [Clostridia bacterium]|nr:hypothetical protein [Clostridia bacterium]